MNRTPAGHQQFHQQADWRASQDKQQTKQGLSLFDAVMSNIHQTLPINTPQSKDNTRKLVMQPFYSTDFAPTNRRGDNQLCDTRYKAAQVKVSAQPVFSKLDCKVQQNEVTRSGVTPVNKLSLFVLQMSQTFTQLMLPSVLDQSEFDIYVRFTQQTSKYVQEAFMREHIPFKNGPQLLKTGKSVTENIYQTLSYVKHFMDSTLEDRKQNQNQYEVIRCKSFIRECMFNLYMTFEAPNQEIWPLMELSHIENIDWKVECINPRLLLLKERSCKNFIRGMIAAIHAATQVQGIAMIEGTPDDWVYLVIHAIMDASTHVTNPQLRRSFKNIGTISDWLGGNKFFRAYCEQLKWECNQELRSTGGSDQPRSVTVEDVEK